MNDRTDADFNLDELLHPANAFGDPSEVLNDPDLTLNEKRAILASWASDVCAVEAAPELRMGPQGVHVRFDEIIEAHCGHLINSPMARSTVVCSAEIAYSGGTPAQQEEQWHPTPVTTSRRR